MKNIILFIIGGLGYGLLEILWRGFTHPSMLILGGICFCFIHFTAAYFTELGILKKGILSALFITSAEFITGLIVNIYMSLSVWDYSSVPFNLNGQISLFYSFIWFILSVIIIKTIEKFSKQKNGT